MTGTDIKSIYNQIILIYCPTNIQIEFLFDIKYNIYKENLTNSREFVYFFVGNLKYL